MRIVVDRHLVVIRGWPKLNVGSLTARSVVRVLNIMYTSDHR